VFHGDRCWCLLARGISEHVIEEDDTLVGGMVTGFEFDPRQTFEAGMRPDPMVIMAPGFNDRRRFGAGCAGGRSRGNHDLSGVRGIFKQYMA